MDNIICLQVGLLQTNCYIIASDKNNAVIIDPGAQPEIILDEIEKNSLQLKKIVLTHAHSDHIGALYDLKLKTGAQIYIHKDEADSLCDPEKNLTAAMNIKNFTPVSADITMSEGDEILLDNIKLKVLHTPGHTKGSVALISDGVIYSGDTLFKGECGRTDLPGGDYVEMLSSLKKLSGINGEYLVLPGHGESSDLSYEKKNNPYMRMAVNETDF